MRIWYRLNDDQPLTAVSIDKTKIPAMKLNIWRQYWASFIKLFASIPIALDEIVKGLGVLGAMIIGLLTLRGKLGELIRFLLPESIKKQT